MQQRLEESAGHGERKAGLGPAGADPAHQQPPIGRRLLQPSQQRRPAQAGAGRDQHRPSGRVGSVGPRDGDRREQGIECCQFPLTFEQRPDCTHQSHPLETLWLDATSEAAPTAAT